MGNNIAEYEGYNLTEARLDNQILVAMNPLEIGGDTAISDLPEEYKGKVQVVRDGDVDVIAVMPNVESGLSVARYAITPNGGFGSVFVLPAPAEMQVTENNFMEWLD